MIAPLKCSFIVPCCEDQFIAPVFWWRSNVPKCEEGPGNIPRTNSHYPEESRTFSSPPAFFTRMLAHILRARTPSLSPLILKEPQVIETRASPRIDFVLITTKTQVKIHFVQ